MPHNARVRYSNELLAAGRLKPGWSAQVDDRGVVTVSGPCPKCGGDAFGPPLPELPGVEDLVLLDRPAEEPNEELRRVLAECRCGFSHGDDDAKSCGRSWYVNVKLG
jgi:hypothetical protein